MFTAVTSLDPTKAMGVGGIGPRILNTVLLDFANLFII